MQHGRWGWCNIEKKNMMVAKLQQLPLKERRKKERDARTRLCKHSFHYQDKRSRQFKRYRTSVHRAGRSNRTDRKCVRDRLIFLGQNGHARRAVKRLKLFFACVHTPSYDVIIKHRRLILHNPGPLNNLPIFHYLACQRPELKLHLVRMNFRVCGQL